ncbi:MAG: AtpZ/AtpI family protein [Acidobacteriales bacterium]|nr:AtpZ/AtpI family protein [Terriglobales bacterium]
MSSRSHGPEDRNPWTMVARYSEIGFIIPAAVVLGLLLGKLLDYWLHTTWLYIAGLVFGAVVGFIDMMRRAIASTSDEK